MDQEPGVSGAPAGELRRRLCEAVKAACDDALDRDAAYGVDDCALFAAGPLRDVLGYDPAEGWRGSYGSLPEARQRLGRLGLAFAVRAIARRRGWRPVDPADAEPGDVGLIAVQDRTASVSLVSCMICLRRGWFVARGQAGILALRADNVRLAWSII